MTNTTHSAWKEITPEWQIKLEDIRQAVYLRAGITIDTEVADLLQDEIYRLKEILSASLPSQGAEKEGEEERKAKVLRYLSQVIDVDWLEKQEGGLTMAVVSAIDLYSQHELTRLTTELAQLKEQRRKEVEDAANEFGQLVFFSREELNTGIAAYLSKFQGAEGQQNDNSKQP